MRVYEWRAGNGRTSGELVLVEARQPIDDEVMIRLPLGRVVHLWPSGINDHYVSVEEVPGGKILAEVGGRGRPPPRIL